MGKRVHSRWRWPSLDRQALAGLQLRLLEQAAKLVSPSLGAIVYATCSIDPAENGELVGRLLREYPSALEVVEEVLTLPSLGGGQVPLAMHDGGYFAIMRAKAPVFPMRATSS
jgi:16S rRNA (cytosine967-C5)-methyltransferase